MSEPASRYEPRPGSPTSDEEIVRRVVAGETELFELLMRRHNQRVYRAMRAILQNEAEIEDAMQQAYLSAFASLPRFAGDAKFSTWLTRIAVNEALGRRRRSSHLVALESADGTQEEVVRQVPADEPTPEMLAAGRELAQLLESAVEQLPEIYRAVFMLREIEGMSTEDTALALELSVDAVKTRLSRAKALIRQYLYAQAEGRADRAFVFLADRCDRVVQRVMERLRANV